MSNRKRKLNSTFGTIHETIITDTGTLRTSRANLSKVRADRLALERENLGSHREELSAATREVLAEAAIYANKYPDDVGDSIMDFGGVIGAGVAMDGDVVDSDDSTEENEGSETQSLAAGYDRHAVSAARMQIFNSIQGRRHHRRAPRSRLMRNRAMHSAWQDQMLSLARAFLLWKENPCLLSTQAPTTSFHVTMVDISNVLEKSVDQAPNELANVSLLKSGYLGCSPLQPTLAISLGCLELYHQIHRRKPSFSVQGMVKVLCSLHNSLRDQFAIAFDTYLAILRKVRTLVDQALGQDTPHWRMLHACPACNYKQPDEPPLYPARLDAFDGNNSLKRVDGSGHADERSFPSTYLIPAAEVDLFKDDVRLRPGTQMTTGDNVHLSNIPGTQATTGDEVLPSNNSTCTKNWRVANTTSENSTNVFDQTGVFVSACCHGIVQTLVELRQSGELAKYALATANKLIDVYGAYGVTGYDIRCSFSKTIAASSVADKVKKVNHRFVVNAFHGHAHNRRCQLQYHTLYQKGLGIEDLETYRYQELSQFLYNNYKQALRIINDLAPVVQELKQQLDLSDADFEQWNIEELQYLEALAAELEYNPEKIAYVEALQSLAKAEAEYGSITSVQFLSYAPADFTQNSGLHKGPQTATKASLDLEHRLGLTEHWTPRDPEYQEALEYLNNNRFVHAVQRLEGLVVQRLFKLAKANLASTGYKMRQQISNAITRRLSVIRHALEHYNQLACLQSPPRDILKFSEVASYAWLGEFELLKSSRQEILTKPWASKAKREVAGKYFKIIRAHEEIERLNVEISCLQRWLDDEDTHLLTTATSLEANQPALAHEIHRLHDKRVHMNNVHRARLQAIYGIPGFCGIRVLETSNDADMGAVIDELQSAAPIEIDEDNILCDEAACLESCIT
ncbi:uncharacterized protein EDB91DRAFT_1080299 [Suillus paluster]|uniref:uncharacterized protein n=1 Tax=Suillus paluster TaxID=48578 RepID=UPI001B86A572|nr:uncharacterized protein EDB91DRAFT_1080299 [Suillus paluster]KAG1745370.1 hypothetical protein EDB91DRAFT_1080299 [Suillus paluster]